MLRKLTTYSRKFGIVIRSLINLKNVEISLSFVSSNNEELIFTEYLLDLLELIISPRNELINEYRQSYTLFWLYNSDDHHKNVCARKVLQC